MGHYVPIGPRSRYTYSLELYTINNKRPSAFPIILSGQSHSLASSVHNVLPCGPHALPGYRSCPACPDPRVRYSV